MVAFFSQRDDFFALRIVVGFTAVGLAVVVVVVDGVHDAFLILVGIAALVFALPWQRLSGFKAGPFAFSLTEVQVEGAIKSIEIKGERISGERKERLEDLLSRLKVDIERARGSRVLWVDDEPHRVLPERRLLRSLGIGTVSIPYTRDATEMLWRDNDFDLVITSLYKSTERRTLTEEPSKEDRELGAEDRRLEGEDRELLRNEGRKLGVLFVQWIRGGTNADSIIPALYGKEIRDPLVNNLPVLFYVAAIKKELLWKEILPAAEQAPGVELAQKMDDFLATTIRLLADARSNPIPIQAEKMAPGGGGNRLKPGST